MTCRFATHEVETRRDDPARVVDNFHAIEAPAPLNPRRPPGRPGEKPGLTAPLAYLAGGNLPAPGRRAGISGRLHLGGGGSFLKLEVLPPPTGPGLDLAQ
jgi:hypothetical protein